MPLADESIIGLPDFKIVDGQGRKTVEFAVEYMGVVQCPYCSSQWLRKKDSFLDSIIAVSGLRPTSTNAGNAESISTRVFQVFYRTKEPRNHLKKRWPLNIIWVIAKANWPNF